MSLLAGSSPAALSRPAGSGALAASFFLLLVIIAAAFPALLTPLDPLRTQVADALQTPSFAHPFGTDQAGRDVFARVVHGTRYSVTVGLGASLIALLAGLVIGVLAGLAPRSIDGVIGRLIAIAMSFPEFLLALLVIAVIGPGERSLIAAIALAAIPAYARIARGQTLVVKNSSYVRAATSLGVPPLTVALRHVVPNTLGPLLALGPIGVGTAIVTVSGLSFLGLGPQPPTPEWGLILSDGRNFLATAWWITFFPGLVITVTVISTSVLARYLRSRGSGGRA